MNKEEGYQEDKPKENLSPEKWSMRRLENTEKLLELTMVDGKVFQTIRVSTFKIHGVQSGVYWSRARWYDEYRAGSAAYDAAPITLFLKSYPLSKF